MSSGEQVVVERLSTGMIEVVEYERRRHGDVRRVVMRLTPFAAFQLGVVLQGQAESADADLRPETVARAFPSAAIYGPSA